MKNRIAQALMGLLCCMFAAPAMALCDIGQGVRVTPGGSGGLIWVTYWCPPTAKWLDYTPDWGSLSLTANAAVTQKVIAGIQAGDTAALRAQVTDTTRPDAVTKQLMATQPPAPVVVAKNGSNADRPSYAVIQATGLRATTAYGRAPVGARAVCSAVLIVEGSSVYCPWINAKGTFANNLVALVSQAN